MPLSTVHSEGFIPATRARSPSLRRPLAGLAVSFIAGLLVPFSGPVSLPLLLWALFLVLLIFFLARRVRGAAMMLHLATVLTGFTWRQLEEQPIAATEVVRLMSRPLEHVQVVGVVVDDPATLRTERGETSWRFPVRVEAFQHAGRWQRARGHADVYWVPGAGGQEVRYGDRRLLEGPALIVEAEPGAGPRIRLKLRGADAQCLAVQQGNALRARCLEARRASARLLARGLEDYPDAAGIMQAFMLGYRETLPERAARAFSRTGTLHIAAISGAHVVILAGLLLIPLKALGFPQTRWIYVMGPLLVLYALATGLGASAVRACIMACVFWSAYAFRRRPDGPTSLAVSALLILAVAPGQLWEAGFVLSFGVVAGLMLLVQPISLPWLARREPELGVRATRWSSLYRRVRRPVITLFAVTLSAWLASLPMTAQYFNLFSPIGLVANLLVVPLASIILLNGCLSLTLGWLSPLAAEVFNHASRVLVQVLLFLVESFHRVPGGHWFVRAPAWWAAALWYGWLVLMARGRPATRRWGWGLALLVALGCAVWYVRNERVQLAMTPMGRGLSVLIEGPRGRQVLVDPGPAFNVRQLVRWLRTRGVNQLDAVLVTRATAEASGAVPELMAEIPVHELWVPDTAGRSPNFAALLELAQTSGVKVVAMGRGARGHAVGPLGWEVLHPDPRGSYANSASAALVLRISQGASSLLLVGSPHLTLQQALLEQPLDLAASGLIATSWPNDAAWSESWLAAVRAPWRLRPMSPDEQAFGSAENPGEWAEEDVTAIWRLTGARGAPSPLQIRTAQAWR